MLDVYAFSSDKAGESFTATFDLTKIIENGYEAVYVSAIDYATNETIDGSEITYDPPYYYVPDTYSDSFEGEWAIGGFPYDSDADKFLSDAPVLLTSDGTELDTAAAGDVVTEDFAFATARTDIFYTFTEVDGSVYTIQSADGKYLAAVDGKIAFVDTADETAQWIVFTDEMGLYAYVYSLANDDLTLLFDHEAGEFAIFDDSVASEEFEGKPCYPSEYFYIWLFARTTGGFEPNYIDIVDIA